MKPPPKGDKKSGLYRHLVFMYRFFPLVCVSMRKDFSRETQNVVFLDTGHQWRRQVRTPGGMTQGRI